MTRRSAAVAVMSAGALWGVLFAVGFTQYTSNASVVAVGLGGLGLLGVWSARRRFVADDSPVGKWIRLLTIVGHDCVAFAVINMTGRQARDLIAAYWDVHINHTLITLVIALMAVLCWWVSNAVLWRVIEALLYIALAVAVWTTYVVVRGGGYDGNHFSTLVGSGASSAMILRGVAVAVVSFVIVDLVIARWRNVPTASLVLVRPAIIFLTLITMGLTYVVVTGAGTFTSNIPFTFAGVAATYGGHGAQVACELLYVGLLLVSSIVLLRDVRDSPIFGATFAGGSSSRRGRALLAVAVMALSVLPLGIAEMFQLGIAVTLIAWFVLALRAMVHVSRDAEPWYEWFPPVVAASITSLGLYGAVDRHLSWDGQSFSRHVTQTVVVVVAISAVAYALEVRRGSRQGPWSVTFDDQREVE